jgi:hypothetical protein
LSKVSNLFVIVWLLNPPSHKNYQLFLLRRFFLLSSTKLFGLLKKVSNLIFHALLLALLNGRLVPRLNPLHSGSGYNKLENKYIFQITIFNFCHYKACTNVDLL